MKNLWIQSAALAALLPLAACGSGPSDADIAKALTAFAVGMGVPEKQAAPKSLKDAKCAKGEGDGYECDFLVDDAPHHARFVKFGDGWKLVGQLG
jgi:hypothetical protein